MTRAGSRDSGNPSSAPTHLDDFLLRFVRARPGVTYEQISRPARLACAVSRSTATRHLARLVRFGDLNLRSDHTYAVGEPRVPDANAVVEYRWIDDATVIGPDGIATFFMQREFRVVSRQLDHMEIAHPKPVRQLSWWGSMPARVRLIPPAGNPDRDYVHHFEFQSPLPARNSVWQWLRVSEALPRWFRMARKPSTGRSRGPHSIESDYEGRSMAILSHGPRFERRVAPGGHLRLQVILPEGYPIGRVENVVRFTAEPEQFDRAEEHRLSILGQSEWHQDGLRVSGSTFTLSVPRPLVNRRYEIRWNLPSEAERDRWLAAHHQRVSSAGHGRAPRVRASR
jgi:hypothetical protein